MMPFVKLFQNVMGDEKAKALAETILQKDKKLTVIGFKSGFQEQMKNTDAVHMTLDKEFGIDSAFDRNMVISALKRDNK